MILACLLMALLAADAQAQLDDRLRELEHTKRQIASSRAKSAEISANIDRMEREMNELAEEITEIAGHLETNEAQLAEIAEKLAELEQERTRQKEALAERKQQVQAMLSTLLRLGQMPKESALLMPANFVSKVKATRTLSMTTQGLRMEMDSLSLQLVELKRLEHDIASRRGDLESRASKLRARQQELRAVVTARKGMMESLYSENQQQQKAIASLIERSEDLQSLVNTLEKARSSQVEEQFRRIGLPVPKPAPPGTGKTTVAQTGERVRAAPRTSLTLPSIREAKGRLRMPTGGKVVGGYGQRRGVNDTLKGVEIATRSHAQVVAPFDGEVLFTGPFRDYGNMVILRHSDNYHTLLAGLTALDCVPGQRVRGGEPVGVMGETIEARRLYLELRNNGKPTDPKPWIAGFSSYLAQN